MPIVCVLESVFVLFCMSCKATFFACCFHFFLFCLLAIFSLCLFMRIREMGGEKGRSKVGLDR